MGKIDASPPPPIPDLSGLWAVDNPAAGIQAPPLLALSNAPSEYQQLLAFAPKLDAPPGDIDMDSLTLFVSTVQSLIASAQTKVSLAGITRSQNENHVNHQKAIEKEEEAKKKAKEAEEAAKKAMVGEWISAIAGLIGAVLGAIGAALLTGGALAAVAVVGVLMAVQNVANVAIKQANMDGAKIETTDALNNTKQLSLSWGAAVEATQAALVADGSILRTDKDGNVIDAKGNKMTKEQLKAALEKNPLARVVSEDQLGKERLAATVVIEAGIAIAMIACGVRGMMNAGDTVKKAVEQTTKSVKLGIELSNKTWESIGRWSEGITAVTDVTSAAGDITTGAYAIVGANVQLESDDARAEQHFYEKKTKLVMATLRQQETLLKKLVQALNDAYEMMCGEVKESGDLRVSIARKIVTTN